MNRRHALTALLVAPMASSAVLAQEAPSGDVLERIKIRNVDFAERRPGTNWKAYDKVLVQPADVSFSRSWSARDYGTFGLSTGEVARMRGGLAALVNEVFTKVLREGGYGIVDAPGEGVLAIKPDIVDLFVNAPDTMAPGRSRSYVMNAGEMRLSLLLSDSVTGTVLARARDKRRGSETGRLEWANSLYNRVEAERALRGWAMQLRDALDAVRTAP